MNKILKKIRDYFIKPDPVREYMNKEQLEILKKIRDHFIKLDPKLIDQSQGSPFVKNVYVKEEKYCGACVGWHIASLFCEQQFTNDEFFRYKDGVKFMFDNFSKEFNMLLSAFAHNSDTEIFDDSWSSGVDWQNQPVDVFSNLYEYYKGGYT